MRFVIDKPQQSDMGCGFGHIENCENKTLKEVLNWIEKNACDWGIITIFSAGEVIRRFDYDIFNNHKFYHDLTGWHYALPVREVKYSYCFMNKDIDIYI